jgi:hypothetical protein
MVLSLLATTPLSTTAATQSASSLPDELEALRTAFESDLSNAQSIINNRGFLAPIDTPDQNATKIYTAQQLSEISNVSYEISNASYILMNDIDLSGFNNGAWTPIASHAVPFMGTFELGGHRRDICNYERLL